MSQTTPFPGKKRLFEIDGLLAVAIILIMFSHLDGYLHSGDLARTFDPYFGVFGLALFFLVSGYSPYVNNPQISMPGDAVAFYKKRVFRINPAPPPTSGMLIGFLFRRLSAVSTSGNIFCTPQGESSSCMDGFFLMYSSS